MKIFCHNCQAVDSMTDRGGARGRFPLRCTSCGTPHGNRATESGGQPGILRGRRNDTSLLFSLDAVDWMAPDGGDIQSARTTLDRENSGLVDLRPMAMGTGESARGGGVGSAADPVGSPVLTPIVAQPRRRTTRLVVVTGICSFVSVVAAALTLVIASANSLNSTVHAGVGAGQAQVAAKPMVAVQPVLGVAPRTEPNARVEAPSAPSLEPAGVDISPGTDSRPLGGTDTRRPPRRPKPKPAPKSEQAGKCLDEVACLLAVDAPRCCSRYAEPERRPGPESTDPDPIANQPTKRQIQLGMDAVRSTVAACGHQVSDKGTVKLRIRIAGNGSVTDVEVKSTPSDALGRCVADAVKRAEFPPSRSGIRFTYPYIF